MSIEIRGLVHVYGSGAGAVAALQGLDLQVRDGEICIVRGPNGSGKSTLIGVLTGSIVPTAGEVRVSEVNGAQPRVAIIRQFDELAARLTVREHFELFTEHSGMNTLPETLRHRRIEQLTAAERQQVAIALALSSEPDLLLADEPTGALAPDDAAEVYALLAREARERHMTLLLVTHDARAEGFADRVVRLQDGRVSQEWEPGQHPRQVLDDRGWVRIPDDIRPQLGRLLNVDATDDGAMVRGRNDDLKHTTPKSQRRAANGSVAIACADLTVSPGGHALFPPLTTAFDRGRVTAVTGAPGAGKSTLLRVLAGLVSPTSGSIHGDGNVDAPLVAYFSAELPFASELSLNELGVSPQLHDQLDLQGMSARPLRTLSGGQRQRAIVALALAHPSPVVLLDDPTTALDDDSVGRVLNALMSSEKTVIAATHDARLVAVADARINLVR